MAVWRQEGFAEFRRGTCGNAGHNLYVSHAGILQRIHHWDSTGTGYPDLLFCNSQDHWEQAPASVFERPFSGEPPRQLRSDGSMAGLVADLNGDGCDDLILGMWHNGVHQNLNALVYFGDPDGFSERRVLELPVPLCRGVAAGDFDGDGRVDLAFLRRDGVRLFLQNELGYEPKRFHDVAIEGIQATAGDLDGDGCADLVVRQEDGGLMIYWGGVGGLDPERCTAVPQRPASAAAGPTDAQAAYVEFVPDATPLPGILTLAGRTHLFAPGTTDFLLIPVSADRTFGEPRRLACNRPMAAAVGDVDGDGWPDLVVACRDRTDSGDCSWVYWGDPDGWRAAARTALPGERACDVAVGDLDGDGGAEIVVCQCHRQTVFTAPSSLFRGCRDRRFDGPVALPCHDARRVFLARRGGTALPQVVFVNHTSRGVLGNVDVSLYTGGPDGYRPDRCIRLAGWGAVESLRPDLNDDGLPDVVLANCSENSVSRDPGSYVFFNTPRGLPHEPDLRLPTTRAHGVCCADLDRDGYLDLVFAGFNNPEILIFRGGPGGFDLEHPQRLRLEFEGQVYKEPRWIYLADLNGDGWLDLVVPQILADRSFVLWGGPDGFSTERVLTLSVERAACARAADLTGNGYPDLILGGHSPTPGQPHDSFVYIYWNGPDGLRQDRRAMLPANGINALCLGDFNNDGRLDLFVGSYQGVTERDIDSFIYWNRPETGFSRADRRRLFTHSASGCIAADLNGDGWTDLVVANHKVWGDHTGYSEIWWNGPDGFRPERTTRLPTSGPHGMSAVEPGNLMDRGPEEFYESGPLEVAAPVAVQRFAWEAETPGRTWVRGQVRAAETRAGLAAMPWCGPGGPGTWFERPGETAPRQPDGRWLQYRLALGAPLSCGSPRVKAVELHYG